MTTKMKAKLLTLAFAVFAVGLSVSCQKTDVVETKTIAELLATNPEIPETEDMVIPPTNAWVNLTAPDCRAFICRTSDNIKHFRVQKIGDIGFGFSNDEFAKVDKNTYSLQDEDGTYIIHMTSGKFTSFEYKPEPGNEYESLGGVYAPVSMGQ